MAGLAKGRGLGLNTLLTSSSIFSCVGLVCVAPLLLIARVDAETFDSSWEASSFVRLSPSMLSSASAMSLTVKRLA